ncbi:helix-turn-helix domain-containing protein [bacterium]|nr:helix-turn-helix domain-containing protein [bacterium]
MKINKTKFFEACAKKGLTFLDVVKKAGLSRNVIVSINKGKNVNSKNVGKLAASLEIEPGELLEGA